MTTTQIINDPLKVAYLNYTLKMHTKIIKVLDLFDKLKEKSIISMLYYNEDRVDDHTDAIFIIETIYCFYRLNPLKDDDDTNTVFIELFKKHHPQVNQIVKCLTNYQIESCKKKYCISPLYFQIYLLEKEYEKDY
jgi:uncharacterized Ntn-hydrolase superfamily protein